MSIDGSFICFYGRKADKIGVVARKLSAQLAKEMPEKFGLCIR
jgi:hypothetical protein